MVGWLSCHQSCLPGSCVQVAQPCLLSCPRSSAACWLSNEGRFAPQGGGTQSPDAAEQPACARGWGAHLLWSWVPGVCSELPGQQQEHGSPGCLHLSHCSVLCAHPHGDVAPSGLLTAAASHLHPIPCPRSGAHRAAALPGFPFHRLPQHAPWCHWQIKQLIFISVNAPRT